MLKGKGLKPASWKEMFSPQIRIRSKRQSGPLAAETTADNDDIALSYGLGWGLLETPHGRGAFKEGDGFFQELLEVSIADVYTPGEWQDYVPYDRSP